MKLIRPSMAYTRSFRELTDEMRAESDGFPAFWNALKERDDIEGYIRERANHAHGKQLPDGWVPASTFWLVDGDEIVGEANLRHELTEHLRTVGGHVGYWIRPSMRRKGYGAHILRMILPEAKKIGIERLLVTCDETNEASRRIIETNGGVLERARDMGPGIPKKLLYWIEL